MNATTTVARGIPRAFDFVTALLAAIVLAPVMLVCALAVAVSSRGAILFRQTRVGRDGKPFTLLKFRTMRQDAGGPEITSGGDSRITPVGKYLRAFKLDELPQLWNIIRGDMAWVGPRPEVAVYVSMDDERWKRVLAARPGLTDPVTIRLRHEERLLAGAADADKFYRELLLPWKLQGYAEYLSRRTVWSDVRLILDTVRAILRPDHEGQLSIAELECVERTAGQPVTSHVQSLIEPEWSHTRTSTPALRLAMQRWPHAVMDVVVLSAAYVVAYVLRFEFAIPRAEWLAFALQFPLVVALQISVLILVGAYRFIWRYIGIAELTTFVFAAGISMAPLLGLRILLPVALQAYRVPISVILIDAVLALSGLIGIRVARRMVFERVERSRKKRPESGPMRVLLIGAGRAGRALVQDVSSRSESDLDIRGFIDDDPRKLGAVIQGVRVVGNTQDLPWLVREYDVDHVVITISEGSRPQFRRILDICERLPVKVKIIPSTSEVIHDKVTVSRIRDFDIADLLGRQPVNLGRALFRDFLKGKAVMITGAGGSIGSELVRLVACCGPSNLLLVERGEPALFKIDFEMRRAHAGLCITPLLGDVANRSSMRRIFARYRPHVILHAAAHKHVPILETNVSEAAINNVIGTRILAEVAVEFRSEAMVLISSDKAVRPTSILGATKRLAELAVQDLDSLQVCRFLAVRFGNVIGSAGSVIPIFQEQIRRGGPVTVTDPAMVRYFMTIPEAAELVLEATAMGKGGEIFILDMGEPVRILSLAEDVITLSGLRPYQDIDIAFTGIRPGEKLAEELEIKEEEMSRTRHPKIFIGRIAKPSIDIRVALKSLEHLAEDADESGIRTLLSRLLPEATLKPEPRVVLSGVSVRAAATGE